MGSARGSSRKIHNPMQYDTALNRARCPRKPPSPQAKSLNLVAAVAAASLLAQTTSDHVHPLMAPFEKFRERERKRKKRRKKRNTLNHGMQYRYPRSGRQGTYLDTSISHPGPPAHLKIFGNSNDLICVWYPTPTPGHAAASILYAIAAYHSSYRKSASPTESPFSLSSID